MEAPILSILENNLSPTLNSPRNTLVDGTKREVPFLPPSSLMHKLLSIFWTQHHNVELCGFLHRASFEAGVNETHNQFLACSIVSLALLYVSDEIVRSDYGFPDAITASNTFALQARNLAMEQFDTPSGRQL